MMKPLFSLLFMVVILVSCQKESVPVVDNNAATTVRNVSYGNDTAQRMDIYLPANRNTTSTKVLIMVHGGAWSTGDKTDFDSYITDIRPLLPGYAIFNINYRLALLPSSNLFPTQENDVKAAVNFVLSKAGEYRFNKEKLVVFGASAGGHLALLQAYKNAAPPVKALVDMFGPTDMTAFYASSTTLAQAGLQALLSGTPSTNPSLYQSSSPLNFVSAQSPPTLILHGGADPLVPLAQSTALKNKLESFHVPVEMVVYPSEGHGWSGPNLTDSYNRIVAFLNQYNP